MAATVAPHHAAFALVVSRVRFASLALRAQRPAGLVGILAAPCRMLCVAADPRPCFGRLSTSPGINIFCIVEPVCPAAGRPVLTRVKKSADNYFKVLPNK
jgi:hypothetical protein